MKPSEGALHAGHRERMRQKIMTDGVSVLQSHEILEFLLFYCIPKRDVNPLAHRLLNAFGSLEGVLTAGADRLAQIDGVGRHTAETLSLFSGAIDAYMDSSEKPCRQIGTAKGAIEEALRLFSRSGRQEMAVLCLDAGGALLSGDTLAWDGMAPAQTRRLMDIVLGSRAQRVAFVWKRLGAARRLNPAEVKDVSELIFLLTGAEVYIVDYLLLHGRRFSSLRQEGILCDRDFPAGASERRRWMDSLDSDGPDYQDGFFRLKALDEGGAAR